MEMKKTDQRTNCVVSVWIDNMNASVWGTSTTLRFIKNAQLLFSWMIFNGGSWVKDGQNKHFVLDWSKRKPIKTWNEFKW